MICREVVTEPFESVCIDIAGPLPKARGGYTHILTYEVYTARPVAEPVLEIFSRNRMPRVMISDQGAQLIASLKQLPRSTVRDYIFGYFWPSEITTRYFLHFLAGKMSCFFMGQL